MNPHEKTGMLISLFGSLFFALLGIIFALLTGSQAVLLDGAFNLIAVITVLFAMKIQKLLSVPFSQRMPAGYVALEPFYILTKGLLILIITIFVVVSNIIIMLKGGNEINLGIIIIYIAIAIIGNLIVYFLISARQKKTTSPMLELEKANWMINTLISTGIGVAFVIVFLFRDGFLNPFVPYVDQVIVIAVGIFTLSVPINAIRTGIRELLLTGPTAELQAKVENMIQPIIRKEQVINWKVFVLKTGRKYWISVFVNPARDKIPADFSDVIKSTLQTAISKDFPENEVDVLITKKIGQLSSTDNP